MLCRDEQEELEGLGRRDGRFCVSDKNKERQYISLLCLDTKKQKSRLAQNLG